MSIQGEIDRIKTNVADAYTAVSEKGGSTEGEQTSAHLAEAIRSIPDVDVSGFVQKTGDTVSGPLTFRTGPYEDGIVIEGDSISASAVEGGHSPLIFINSNLTVFKAPNSGNEIEIQPHNNTISGLQTPTLEDHAANKGYVDSVKTTVSLFTTTLSTAWNTNSAGGFTKTQAISGIKATDSPVVDVVLGTDVAANQAILESWACVGRIVTAENSITVYAYDSKPQVNLPLQLKVVR